MASIVDSIIDFIRNRQLNIAVAAVLTGFYLIYQYWDVLTKSLTEEQTHRHGCRTSRSRSRSGARSRSRSKSGQYYRLNDPKKRGRKSHRRCPDCSLCDFEQQ